MILYLVKIDLDFMVLLETTLIQQKLGIPNLQLNVSLPRIKITSTPLTNMITYSHKRQKYQLIITEQMK